MCPLLQGRLAGLRTPKFHASTSIILYICSLPLWYSDNFPSSRCKALGRNCHCCESGPPLYSAFIHGKIPTPWSNPCRYPWYTASKAQSFMVNGLIVVTFWFKCICFLPHSQVDLLVIVVRAKYGSMFPGLHDFSMVHSKHQDGCLS